MLKWEILRYAAHDIQPCEGSSPTSLAQPSQGLSSSRNCCPAAWESRHDSASDSAREILRYAHTCRWRGGARGNDKFLQNEMRAPGLQILTERRNMVE